MCADTHIAPWSVCVPDPPLGGGKGWNPNLATLGGLLVRALPDLDSQRGFLGAEGPRRARLRRRRPSTHLAMWPRGWAALQDRGIAGVRCSCRSGSRPAMGFAGKYKSIQFSFREIVLIDNSMLYNVSSVIFGPKLRAVAGWVADPFS